MTESNIFNDICKEEDHIWIYEKPIQDAIERKYKIVNVFRSCENCSRKEEACLETYKFAEMDTSWLGMISSIEKETVQK